ncbi:aldo/keto reductase [Pontibacter sp. SGAir0037]|uniref:aldo/keto reductase n=1 Tax=Pontibacter sp. SGAir0037 TaxID=2571030 RepID=UPI0010CD3502|nr:aldo/keto reductase [Pontibacter sp. SGAir0037]QCR22820.1 hypothetical protein C1N53_11020 [Pontibacter sp. SGAir0037]
MALASNFSPIGLGTSLIASLGNSITQKEAGLLFAKALERGVSVVDTADTYGSGDAERMIGRAISGKRDNYFLITKAGFPYMSLPGSLSPLNQIGKKLYQKVGFKKNYSKRYLLQAAQKSLQRLQTSTLDAFLLHEPEGTELNSFPDFGEGLAEIKKSGLARNIGISTNDLGTLKFALSKTSIDIVQTSVPYSPEDNTVFDYCKKNKIPVIANQVLRASKKFSESISQNSKLDSLGITKSDIPPLLISYTLQYRNADCVLIGTRSPQHLLENTSGIRFNDNLDLIFSEISKISL